LYVQFGKNPDGDSFGAADGDLGWGFWKSAGGKVAIQKWMYGDAFVGDNNNGAYVSLTPIEPLKIGFSVPFIDFRNDTAINVYKRTNAGVSYELPIGTAGIYYQGNLNTPSYDKDGNVVSNASKLGASFLLTAVDNLVIALGVGYSLPVRSDKIGDDNLGEIYGKKAGDTTVTISDPVAIGLGVRFRTGALGIKARVAGKFGGKSEGEGVGAKLYPTYDKNGNKVPLSSNIEKKATEFEAILMPYFDITDKVSAYLNTGMGVTKPEAGDTTVAWFINPYVSFGGGDWPNFWAGVQIQSDGTKDAAVKWSVPLGMTFGF
jgi:hypothetical protein